MDVHVIRQCVILAAQIHPSVCRFAPCCAANTGCAYYVTPYSACPLDQVLARIESRKTTAHFVIDYYGNFVLQLVNHHNNYFRVWPVLFCSIVVAIALQTTGCDL